jgi:hypothetical protein
MMYGIAGCSPLLNEEQDGEVLSFTTIAQNNSLNYEGVRPRIMVIATAQEVEGVANSLFVNRTAETADLRQLDYDRAFAVLVFEGWQNSGNKTTIQRMIRDGDRVMVEAAFVDPPPESGQQGDLFQPYHLVAIPKTEAWNQLITFELINNGEKIAEITHTIP